MIRQDLSIEDFEDMIDDLLFYSQFVIYDQDENYKKMKKKLKKLKHYVEERDVEKFLEDDMDEFIT